MNLKMQLNSLADGIPRSLSSSTKRKRYLIPLTAAILIILILTVPFTIYHSNTPNIPTINRPYTTPELLWQVEDIYDLSYSYPIVLDGVIYANTQSRPYGIVLYAINMTNGNIIWQKNVLHSNVSFSTFDIDNIVYTSASYGGLNAWNAKDGTIIWNSKFSCYTTLVVNGIVYAIARGGIGALNAADGTELWVYGVGYGFTNSVPTIVNDIVYSGFGNHKVCALDAKNGKLLWEFTTGEAIYSSPAVVNGVVYIGSDDHKIYALNAQTGEKIWSYTTGGKVGSPVVKYGVVYVSSSDQNIYALNAQTGKKIWTHNLSDSNNFITTLAVANGVVYTTSYDSRDNNSFLYALSAANGNKLWSQPNKEMIESLVIIDNNIYIITSTKMYAFSTIKPL